MHLTEYSPVAKKDEAGLWFVRGRFLNLLEVKKPVVKGDGEKCDCKLSSTDHADIIVYTYIVTSTKNWSILINMAPGDEAGGLLV